MCISGNLATSGLVKPLTPFEEKVTDFLPVLSKYKYQGQYFGYNVSAKEFPIRVLYYDYSNSFIHGNDFLVKIENGNLDDVAQPLSIDFSEAVQFNPVNLQEYKVRIVFPTFGSPLTYVTFGSDDAPGSASMADIKNLQNIFDNLSQTFDNFQSMFNQYKAEIEQKLNDIIKNESEHYAELANQLKEHIHDYELLVGRVNDLKNQVDILIQDNDMNKIEIANLKEQVKKNTEILAKLKAAFFDEDGNIIFHPGDLEEIIRQINNLELSVSKIHQQLLDIQKRFTESNSRVDALEAKVNTFKNSIDHNTASLATAKTNISALQETVNSILNSLENIGPGGGVVDDESILKELIALKARVEGIDSHLYWTTLETNDEGVLTTVKHYYDLQDFKVKMEEIYPIVEDFNYWISSPKALYDKVNNFEKRIAYLEKDSTAALSKEIARLDKRIDNNTEVDNRLRADINLLSDKEAKNEADITGLNRAFISFNTLANELQRRLDDIKEADPPIADEATINNLQTDIDNLFKKVADLLEVTKTLQDNTKAVNNLQLSTQDLNNRLTILEAADLITRVTNLEEKLENAGGEGSVEDIAGLQDKLDELKKLIDKNTNAINSANKTSSNNLTNINKQFSNIQQQIDNIAVTANDYLRKLIDKNRTAITENNNSISQIIKQLADVMDNLSKLNSAQVKFDNFSKSILKNSTDIISLKNTLYGDDTLSPEGFQNDLNFARLNYGTLKSYIDYNLKDKVIEDNLFERGSLPDTIPNVEKVSVENILENHENSSLVLNKIGLSNLKPNTSYTLQMFVKTFPSTQDEFVPRVVVKNNEGYTEHSTNITSDSVGNTISVSFTTPEEITDAFLVLNKTGVEGTNYDTLQPLDIGGNVFTHVKLAETTEETQYIPSTDIYQSRIKINSNKKYRDIMVADKYLDFMPKSIKHEVDELVSAIDINPFDDAKMVQLLNILGDYSMFDKRKLAIVMLWYNVSVSPTRFDNGNNLQEYITTNLPLYRTNNLVFDAELYNGYLTKPTYENIAYTVYMMDYQTGLDDFLVVLKNWYGLNVLDSSTSIVTSDHQLVEDVTLLKNKTDDALRDRVNLLASYTGYTDGLDTNDYKFAYMLKKAKTVESDYPLYQFLSTFNSNVNNVISSGQSNIKTYEKYTDYPTKENATTMLKGLKTLTDNRYTTILNPDIQKVYLYWLEKEVPATKLTVAVPLHDYVRGITGYVSSLDKLVDKIDSSKGTINDTLKLVGTLLWTSGLKSTDYPLIYNVLMWNGLKKLNVEGLTHFVNEIAEKFDTKVNDLQAKDEVLEGKFTDYEENTFTLVNLTQAEYDALTEEDKNSNTLWVINDAADPQIESKNKIAIDKLTERLDGLSIPDTSGFATTQSVNALTETVTANKTDADGKISELTTKVTALPDLSNYQTTVNDVATTKESLTTLTEKVTDNEGKINTKVDNTVYQAYVEQTNQSLSEKLVASDLQGYAKTADVKQTTDGLSASITKVQGDLSSLQIGGANLLDGSSLEKNIGDSSGFQSNEYADGWRVLTSTSETESRKTYSIPVKLTKNQYAFSVDFKCISKTSSSPAYVQLMFRDTNDYSIYGTNGEQLITLGETRMSCTSNIPNGKTVNFLQIAISSSFVGQIALKNVKLESGNKATDWCMSDNDIQSQLNTLSASIAGNTDKITKLTADVDQLDSVYAKKTELPDVSRLSELDTQINTGDSSLVKQLTAATEKITTLEGTIAALTNRIENLESKSTSTPETPKSEG